MSDKPFSKVTVFQHMDSDWQSAADSFPHPNHSPHEPRPFENDVHIVKLVGGTAHVGRKQTPLAPTNTDKIALRGASSFCDSCVSALGYLAGHLQAEQQKKRGATSTDEEGEHGLLEGDYSKAAVIHHWNALALFLSSEWNKCPLCVSTWDRWRGEVERQWNVRRIESLRQKLTGSGGWEKLDPDLIRQSLRRPHDIEFASVFESRRIEAILTTTDESYWNGKNPGEARLVFALSSGERTGRAVDFSCIVRFQLWPSPAFDRYFTRFYTASEEQIAQAADVDGVDETSTRACRPLALKWLSRCKENVDGDHDACNAARVLWRPTRLLDTGLIKDSGKLKLIDSRSRNGEFVANSDYIALSHCWGMWGALKLPRLNTSNLDLYINEGINLDSLPPTFKDLVEIAGWFKVRYLWIDSLCIIQDSSADWSREAPQMCDVYANALLTVSATASIDAQGGCFKTRQPSSVQPFQLSLPKIGSKWWATVDERNLFDWMTSAPLTTRAWAYQERHLSRRILYFTDTEIFWECSAAAPSFACESYPDGSPLRRDYLGNQKLPPQEVTQATIEESRHLRQAWDDICRDFSNKEITKRIDKLPALSGLANYFGSRSISDIYLAGVWSSTLPRSLLWKAGQRPKRPGPESTDSYIAPSWSWLSTDCPVSMPDYEEYHSIVGTPEISYVTVTGNPFDRVERASLTVEGFVRTIIEVEETRDDPGDLEGPPFWVEMMKSWKSFSLYADGESKTSIGGKNPVSASYILNKDKPDGRETCYFECLLLMVGGRKQARQILGLLIEPTGEENTYRRVGIISFEGRCALKMRYKVRASITGQEDEAWKKLWQHVEPNWKEHFSGGDVEKVSIASSGPESLYEFDAAGADDDIFEKLQPRTIILV